MKYLWRQWTVWFYLQSPATLRSYIDQGAYRSWKVMEFKIQIFQARKLMELGLHVPESCGKSWKINPNGCCISDPCTFSAFTYVIIVHVRLGTICCLLDLVHVCENLTCLISTRLNSPGKSWKNTFSVLYAPGLMVLFCPSRVIISGRLSRRAETSTKQRLPMSWGEVHWCSMFHYIPPVLAELWEVACCCRVLPAVEIFPIMLCLILTSFPCLRSSLLLGGYVLFSWRTTDFQFS